VGVQVKLWDSFRTRAIPERFWGGDSWRGANSCVRTFTFTCVCWQNGNTSLHVAAAEGHLDVVRYLLSTGLDVNLQNKVSFPHSICMITLFPSDMRSSSCAVYYSSSSEGSFNKFFEPVTPCGLPGCQNRPTPFPGRML